MEYLKIFSEGGLGNRPTSTTMQDVVRFRSLPTAHLTIAPLARHTLLFRSTQKAVT